MKRGSNRAKFFLLASILLAVFHVEGRTLEAIEAHPPRYAPRAAERQGAPAKTATSAKPLILSVTATAYTPAGRKTAAGTKMRPGIIAISRDLYARPDIDYGMKVRILNMPHFANCHFVIEDKMGEWVKIKGQKVLQRRAIDLALLTKRYANKWGRRTVDVEILPADAKVPLCTLSKVRAQIDKLHRR